MTPILSLAMKQIQGITDGFVSSWFEKLFSTIINVRLLKFVESRNKLNYTRLKQVFLKQIERLITHSHTLRALTENSVVTANRKSMHASLTIQKSF